MTHLELSLKLEPLQADSLFLNSLHTRDGLTAAEVLQNIIKTIEEKHRHVVFVAGPPLSGKSTVLRQIIVGTNQRAEVHTAPWMDSGIYAREKNIIMTEPGSWKPEDLVKISTVSLQAITLALEQNQMNTLVVCDSNSVTGVIEERPCKKLIGFDRNISTIRHLRDDATVVLLWPTKSEFERRLVSRIALTQITSDDYKSFKAWAKAAGIKINGEITSEIIKEYLKSGNKIAVMAVWRDMLDFAHMLNEQSRGFLNGVQKLSDEELIEKILDNYDSISGLMLNDIYPTLAQSYKPATVHIIEVPNYKEKSKRYIKEPSFDGMNVKNVIAELRRIKQ